MTKPALGVGGKQQRFWLVGRLTVVFAATVVLVEKGCGAIAPIDCDPDSNGAKPLQLVKDDSAVYHLYYLQLDGTYGEIFQFRPVSGHAPGAAALAGASTPHTARS